MPSDELRSLACELQDNRCPRLHSLWPVFALLYTLEMGIEPNPSDLYPLDCGPSHF